MSLEKNIIHITWVVSFLSIWFIPRKMADRATFIFLLTQFFTWILGIVAVEYSMLEYPVRELARANATSFTFEFIIMPILTVFFIIYYPDRKPIKNRLLYYFMFSSVFSAIEFIVERYTKVIHYLTWEWYWTWISMALVFYIVKVIYKWFYKIRKVFLL